MFEADDTRHRVAVAIEYDGAAFCGWQVQKDGPSVQAALGEALARVAAHPVTVVGAGRTDARVHATGQVAHFDTSAERPAHAWVIGTNTYLPDAVAVTWARSVSADFHARFSALARSYVYLILQQKTRPALLRERVCWVHHPLDLEAMIEAARCLEGTHDFSSFRAAQCQAHTPTRTIHSLELARRGALIELRVTANAFLHHMVRNIAGTLITIGRGEQDPGWMLEVLASRDRRRAGVTAPASGLYLVDVAYPSRFGLPRGAARSDGLSSPAQ